MIAELIIGGVILMILGILLIIRSTKYTYLFEEKEVHGYCLEDARSQLEDYHSPLIHTNDRSIV